MINRLKTAWRRSPWLLTLFGVALVVTLGFGVQTVRLTLYWADPAHQNQPLEGWMSPRYVGMSYGLPPEVLGPLLMLDPEAKQRVTMQDVARATGLTLAEIETLVRTAADSYSRDGR